MIKLYKTQLQLLLSNKDVYILLGAIFFIILFLLYTSGFYRDYAYQTVYKSSLFQQYLFDSVAFIKFSLVIFGMYISYLSRKLHFLDGLFISRASKIEIILSRILVLLSVVVVINSVLYVFFLTIGFYLTPIMIRYDYILLFLRLQMFGVIYFLLSYITILLTDVFYAPILILFIYSIGSIFSPYYAVEQEITTIERVVNFFINDLVMFNDLSIAPLFGDLHLLLAIIVIAVSVIFIYERRDMQIL